MDFETYNGIRAIADEIATRITIRFTIIMIVVILILVILFAILYFSRQKSYENKPKLTEIGRPFLYQISPNQYNSGSREYTPTPNQYGNIQESYQPALY